MVNVLVTGSSGYIGFAVASLLSSNGHTVYGLVRNNNPSTLKMLLSAEITPVVGDITDMKVIDPILEKVSVVIDTVVIFGNNPMKSTKDIISSLQSACEKGKNDRRKRYIYTSGILTYNYKEVCDETFSVNNPFMSWRGEIEQFVTNSKDHSLVDGTVLRPGFCYGRSAGKYFGYLFGADSDGNIDVTGDPNKMFSYIHIADLANAYLLAIEDKNAIGEIFDVCDASRVTQEQIRVACARANGVKGKVVYKAAGEDFFSKACEVSCVASANKIKKYLGWKHSHTSIMDHISTILEAYKAAQ